MSNTPRTDATVSNIMLDPEEVSRQLELELNEMTNKLLREQKLAGELYVNGNEWKKCAEELAKVLDDIGNTPIDKPAWSATAAYALAHFFKLKAQTKCTKQT